MSQCDKCKVSIEEYGEDCSYEYNRSTLCASCYIAELEAERGSIKSSHFSLTDAGTVAIGTCGRLNCYPSGKDQVKIDTNGEFRGIHFDKHSIQKLIRLLGQVRNHLWSTITLPGDDHIVDANEKVCECGLSMSDYHKAKINGYCPCCGKEIKESKENDGYNPKKGGE